MPKHDKTPDDEMEESLQEAVRIGDIVEVTPGHFSLTEQGKRKAEALIAESQEARDLYEAARRARD